MRSNVAPAKKNVMFKNWTSEDFIGKWGGQQIVVRAGESLMMDEGIALTLATHLTDREINRVDGWAKFNSRKLPAYQTLVKKAVADVAMEEISNVINDGEADVNEIIRLNANRKTEAQMRKEQAEINEPNLIERSETPKYKTVFCDSCDSKGGRHKKGCPMLAPLENGANELNNDAPAF